ncbi:hypothetical protein ANCCAN_09782 [Ancylostoma caninum]|uniref:E3 ubiquitin-protein ligase listerin n=1 Tax=Ancylostoma caninum TaxID=29170 RepID=A0A368GLP3_ANCCA|nr:hypothetical protein ANCCAN_09782 [Ancylostoma caninum]
MKREIGKTRVFSASSAHAAALLEKSGQLVGLAGFDSGFSNVFEAVAVEETGSVRSEVDSEVVVIFRKLSKKDPQTREKALRELLDIIKGKDAETVALCYDGYTTFIGKLTLDGSPTVRSLSLRITSYFISTLKKAAQRHLEAVSFFFSSLVCFYL